MKRGLIILIIAAFFTLPLKAQVKIGNQTNPQNFSLLEITKTAIRNGGLRMAQLTTAGRDALNLASNPAAAEGLIIYNITTGCLEYWNDTKWVGLCDDVVADCSQVHFPELETSYTFCDGATIANLTTAAGGSVRWYNALTGGNLYESSYRLTSGTYWAEQRVGECTKPGGRIPVEVVIGAACAYLSGGVITTFVNVMYDFQHQTLDAYIDYRSIAYTPTDYRWQVSTTENDSDFTDIPGAPNSRFYTIPAHFADGRCASGDSLFFRCLLSNPATRTPVPTANLDIMFIRTCDINDNPIGNYGKDANGVRYLTINRGGTLNGGKIKVALLNLGQSGTGAYIRNSGAPDDVTPIADNTGTLNDAGDLGDFYQWGRIADGHEHIVWSKQRNFATQYIVGVSYFYMVSWIGALADWGTTGATSDTVNRVTPVTYIDTSTGQVYNPDVNAAGSNFYGKFIFSENRGWDAGANDNSDLWGNTFYTRTDAPVSLNGVAPTWTTRAQANNVCPSGWRVPSRYEWWDIYRGTGRDDPSNFVTDPYNETNAANKNTWRWRDTYSKAIGGVIITNSDDEKLFLPAMGSRLDGGSGGGGALLTHGSTGDYWSSTRNGVSAVDGHFVSIRSDRLSFAANTGCAEGQSVRCVAE